MFLQKIRKNLLATLAISVTVLAGALTLALPAVVLMKNSDLTIKKKATDTKIIASVAFFTLILSVSEIIEPSVFLILTKEVNLVPLSFCFNYSEGSS